MMLNSVNNQQIDAYDIAIVGLGPAGATLARLLSDRYRIIALDKKQKEGSGFSKPCGGLLADDAQKALARFNLSLPKSLLVDPQIFSVKTIDVGTKRIAHYQRFYLNVDRLKFDRWLISLIPSSVSVQQDARCEEIKRLDDGCYWIRYTQNGDERELSARYVIGADGANSLLRRSLFKKDRLKRYVAIQQGFVSNEQAPFYSCIFDRDTTKACAWALFKDDRFIFGGAFEKQHCRQQFDRLKQRLAVFGFAFDQPLQTQACELVYPTSPFSFMHGHGHAFLVGEAAGFISPSSFEGISFALESARALSDAFNSGGSHTMCIYRRNTLQIRLKLFMKMAKRAVLYNPLLRNLIMRSGIKKINVLL